MSLTIASGYTVSSGEVWTPTKHNLSTTIAIQQATATITGRTTAGTGSIEELSPTQARAILGLATTDTPTLAGLVLTGGLNGVAIGNTTPSTVAATTLSTSGSGTVLSTTQTATDARWNMLMTGNTNLALGINKSGSTNSLGINDATAYLATSNGYDIAFGVNSVQVGRFTSTGLNNCAIGATTPSTVGGTVATFTGICNALSFNSTSARRFKKNVRALVHNKARLLGLRPVWYDEKRLGGRKQMVGFIAEDINKFLPGMVAKDLDHRSTGINYGPLVSVAVASLQNHERRLAAIEARQKRKL